jgi:hypothetical protein
MATKPPKKKLSKNADAEILRELAVADPATLRLAGRRLKNVPGFDFPPAAVVNGLEFNDLDKVDAWIEARVRS